jgi:hypothetical protein
MRLYFASLAEQRAVAWFKSSYRGQRGGAKAVALSELAYDPFHQGHDWRKPRNGATRAVWSHWQGRPFGNEQFNRMHQHARHCIRRNVYFPSLARKLGRKSWPDPIVDHFFKPREIRTGRQI